MSRLLLAAALVLSACTGTPAPAPEPDASPPRDAAPAERQDPRRGDADYWVPRTDAELDAAFEATCRAAEASNRPVLLQFSAPWCIDCRRVKALSAEPVLAEELQRWETLVVDPGRMDRHVPLLQAFEVSAIATWVAVRPQDCRLPAPSWTRLRQETFEPATGTPRTAEDLARWLAAARAG
jgi:thiol-disulfide isomerase/thioredoxin